jgi:hypothetical protein
MTNDRAQMKFDENEFSELYSIMVYCLRRNEDKAMQAWQQAVEDHYDALLERINYQQ